MAPVSPEAALTTPAASGPWRDLLPRVVSALVLLPVALGALWLGGWAWGGLVLLGLVGLGWEWSRLTGAEPRGPEGLALQAAGLGGALLAQAGQPVWGFAWVAAAAAAMTARAAPSAVGRWWLPVGALYVGLGGVALVALRAGDAGLGNVLFVLMVVWGSDIGAYLAGRMIGGPKLAPSISPGKTRSGAVGGLLAAVLVGMAVAQGFAPGGAATAAWLAALLAVLSQAGDLFESWVKRRFRVKDSSALIPGHGGLLDRMDALLLAAPAAALLGLALGTGLGVGEYLWR